VLGKGPLKEGASRSSDTGEASGRNPESEGAGRDCAPDGHAWDGKEAESAVGLLREMEGEQVAGDYGAVLDSPEVICPSVRPEEAALLIVDPQRSFTSGAWMRSIGPTGDDEVKPIRLAFRNCARVLEAVYRRVEVMFTRCPFPPESYDWDEELEEIIDGDQLYFVKPGNSALWPPSNGYGRWVESLIRRGKTILVVGGCTLNSCIRVSAIETRQRFRSAGFDVIVDLGLCGARTVNYEKSSLFGGLSSVELAVKQMSASGVKVAGHVVWA
jgi:nicotinamidase-related amidase